MVQYGVHGDHTEQVAVVVHDRTGDEVVRGQVLGDLVQRRVRPERVDVGGLVEQIALSPSGTIFAVTSSGSLIGMDPTGRRAWERRWATSRSQPLTLRVADDGRPWIGLGLRFE